MKRKLCIGLALVAVLLLAAAAAAGAPLTPREIVEQVAVPLALANDPEVGVNNAYSAEELDKIVNALAGNGITLEENSTVMQMWISGNGLYEDAVLTEICSEAFGGIYGTWTCEEQDWFDRQMQKVGCTETYRCRLPGPDNRTSEEAEAFALEALREAYGQDLPLEDRGVWLLTRQFDRAAGKASKGLWSFSLVPMDLEHGRYWVEFSDADPYGTVFVDTMPPTDWTRPYTGEQLLTEFRWVYSWNQGTWPQAVWRKLHGMMQQAELDPDSIDYTECLGIRLTDYPDPGPDELSREEAVRIAKEALNKDRAAFDSAVLTQYGGERAWLVTLVISLPLEGPANRECGSWVVTVDSASGAVRSLREAYGEAAWVPEAACDRIREEMPQETDYIAVAAEAVRARFPETDPLDETEYTVQVSGLRTHYVDFVTKNIRHGSIKVTMDPDGTVRDLSADAEALNGDNLFERYWTVYGYFGGWDQALWVQLGRDASELEADTVGGQVLKATRYPEESSVTVQHAEAQVLGMKATGKRRPEVNTCVLVDAEPHPVWIMRILTDDPLNPVIGIDAETGETVLRLYYEVDETPGYVLYSMPETWRSLERSQSGEAPTPSPLPDGKPWYWGMAFAPQSFWDRAEAFMKERGMTENAMENLAWEWDQVYGDIDFWPQEYQSVYNLYLASEEDLRDPGYWYMPFPDPEKKTQEEIGSLALSAFHEAADAELGAERIDGFRIGSTLYSDSRIPDSEDRSYGKPVWWAWFYEWSEEDGAWSGLRGCVILDEDGSVLTVIVGDV